MVNGKIFLEDDGMNISNITFTHKNEVIKEFCEMRGKANQEGDKFYYLNGENLSYLYSELWGETTSNYWNGIDPIMVELLRGELTNPGISINSIDEFNNTIEYKTHGGFAYKGHPTTNYVHNAETIEKWHHHWYYLNPMSIDWSTLSPNGIFPRYKETIELLQNELQNHIAILETNPTLFQNYQQKEKKAIEDIKNGNVATTYIPQLFHDIVMKHKSGDERESYAINLANSICSLNYYHPEKELASLEQRNGNSKAKHIYRIEKNGKNIFLSLDTAHGMFELCDDNGSHLMEVKFDGSYNASDSDYNEKRQHSLHCVAEWKRTNQ